MRRDPFISTGPATTTTVVVVAAAAAAAAAVEGVFSVHLSLSLSMLSRHANRGLRPRHSHPLLFVRFCPPLTSSGAAVLPTTVLPSTRSVGHKGKMPSTAEASFVAPNAAVIGDVKVSRNTAE